METDFSNKRVLIVDDHVGMRSSLRSIMGSFGATSCEMTGTANDAIRRLQHKPYDIIVCDYFLGDGSDGQQLLEELRHNKLIKLSTVFMIVTAERAYERVVSAVELAPDDYLIKPFPAEVMRLRLERVLRKKQTFADIHALIEADRIGDAIAVCAQAIRAGGKYTIDLMRTLSDLYVVQGSFEEAQQVYEQVLSMRTVPWAQMGLARVMHFQGLSAPAENLLEEVIHHAPEYMAAYDLLAEVYEANDKMQLAQQTLARALAASPYTMHRQKRMGEIALRNGDLHAAEEAYAQVVERGKMSFFRKPDDYANLSRVQIEREKLEAAANTLRELRKTFPKTPEVEFTASVIESLLDNKRGELESSGAALENALQVRQDSELDASEHLALDLAKACLQHGREDEAIGIVDELVRNNHENAALIERAKAVYANAGMAEQGSILVEDSVKNVIQINNQGVLRAQQGDLDGAVELLTQAAEKLPGNTQVVLNAAQALLVHVQQRGWNQGYMETAKKHLALVRKKDANNPKLLVVNKLAQEVARKYGVAT